MKPELLAPAGNFERLKTALHFGADAVYLSGKRFGLRAFSDNFTDTERAEAIQYAHALGKKVYVTVNILARNGDFPAVEEELIKIAEKGADGVIVSDPGVLDACRRVAPSLPIHLSTQANTLNARAAAFWEAQGVRRIVLARELSLKEIAGIRAALRPETELEAFVHGAMCMAYSGRCLMSNYLTGRDSNRGACAQPCRWKYALLEYGNPEKRLLAEEDERGTYFLNSRDLNLIAYLDKLLDAGAASFKIEGRMKSEYYVATVVNAYRRALDALERGPRPYAPDKALLKELEKAAHRSYTTAYLLGENADTECRTESKPAQRYEFTALVIGFHAARGLAEVEMRSRFRRGDVLEILSSGGAFNQTFRVAGMWDEEGNAVEDAKRVQQRLWVECPYPLAPYDILRRELPE